MSYDEALEEMGEHDQRYDVTLQEHLAMQGQQLVAEHGGGRVWVEPPTVLTSGEDRRDP